MREQLKLRPYQEGMREFACKTPKAALFAGMGLGKTPVAITAMQDSMYDYFDTRRWLVVGPKLVVADAWPRQLARWAQFSRLEYRLITASYFGLEAKVAITLHGKQVEIPYSQWQGMDPATRPAARKCGLTLGDRVHKAGVKRALQDMTEDVHLVSWDFLPWLARAWGTSWPYDGVVLDESIFAQSSTSDRHRAIWHVTYNLGRVNRLIELTGAPTPNTYETLHGQIRLLDGGARLGKTQGEFYRNWFVPDRGKGHIVYSWKLRPGAREQIDERLRDICVSLKTEDYLDLPEMVVNPVVVPLPMPARATYRAMERELVATLGEGSLEILAPSQGAKAGKLLQICNGAVYDSDKAWHLVHDAKLDKLEELIEGADGPVLLFYSFEHDWERIQARLGKAAVHIKTRGALDRFRKGKIRVLCLHPASGAHGVDGLQDASSTAIWFGPTRNADHWLQANKRLHRDGQRAGRVMVHVIIAEGTVEEWVAGEEIDRKISQQDWLMESLKLRTNAGFAVE